MGVLGVFVDESLPEGRVIVRYLFERLGLLSIEERTVEWLEVDRETRTRRRKVSQIRAAAKKGRKKEELYGL